MAKTNTQPELRFAGFTEDWEEKDFSQIINLQSGKDYKHLSTGNIPVYGTGGYMTSVSEALSYNDDAIGIGRKGTIDKPFILKAPFWTVDTLFYAIPKPNNYIGFLYCIFQKTDWKQKDESTGVPSLSKNTINSVSAIIPSYIEQKLIGNFFENIDKLITEHQQKHSKLKALKQAMLDKMFPKQGQLVPEIRFKGFEGDWENPRLGNIGDPFTGLSGKAKNDFGHGEGRYITYLNVFSNPISDLNMLEKIEIDSSQNEVIAGDVLFTVSSETAPEVGMSSVWTGNEKNVYLNSFCFGYRPKIKMDNYFLANLLRTQAFREQMTLLAQGISRYNISKNKVMNLTISLPKFDEQVVIGEYFKNVDSLINQHSQQITKLTNLKQAFLAKMFI